MREARLPLVRIEEDGIIAHGVVHSKLVVELDFEVICVQRVEVNGGNSTLIEAAIDEARPPAVRDVQAEAYQCLHPFRVDGNVSDEGGRHRCVASGCDLRTKSNFCSPFLLGENLARRNLRYITTSQLRRKASTKKAQKGPSTHVIGDTSFVKIAIDSKKAEVSRNFSSYQTLTMDNDFGEKLRANEAR